MGASGFLQRDARHSGEAESSGVEPQAGTELPGIPGESPPFRIPQEKRQIGNWEPGTRSGQPLPNWSPGAWHRLPAVRRAAASLGRSKRRPALSPPAPSAAPRAPFLPSPSWALTPSSRPKPFLLLPSLLLRLPLLPTHAAPFHSFLNFLFFFLLAFSPFLVNFAACEQPDCLTKIEQINFNPTHGCPSLAKEIFAIRTNATLILQCPGYYGIQINTQAMKKRKNREVTTNKCLEHVSYLIYLWHRFSRIS
ncbi:thymic stromal lymphopoietin [Manis pentadactyla]|uniref:thymic stromal lymphopoietin n=1 Tax=Manis pentadactyla TaxID=143292 RepID=UPI00255C4323|nr:thymic stromal lymphopoietin [Manis pentadactyla]